MTFWRRWFLLQQRPSTILGVLEFLSSVENTNWKSALDLTLLVSDNILQLGHLFSWCSLGSKGPDPTYKSGRKIVEFPHCNLPWTRAFWQLQSRGQGTHVFTVLKCLGYYGDVLSDRILTTFRPASLDWKSHFLFAGQSRSLDCFCNCSHGNP